MMVLPAKNKAKIFKQGITNLLGKGTASAVYINPNNKNQIIKKAVISKRNANGGYVAHQKHGYDIIDKIRESGQDYGVNLPEFISSVKSISLNSDETPFQSVTETMLPGIRIDDWDYFQLKDSTKNKLALQLAKFMTVIHNLAKPIPATQESRKKDILFRFPQISKENLDKFIQQFKSYRLKQTLADASTVLWQEIGPDEVIVTTHGDLRWPNVIYDKKNKQLGVIDFENGRSGHIYRDFVSGPVSFNWDFVQRIIKQYNKIRKNNNNPIYIDADKIKRLLICKLVNKIIQTTIESETTKASSKSIDTTTQRYRINLINKLERNLVRALQEHGLMDKNPVLFAQNQR